MLDFGYTRQWKCKYCNRTWGSVIAGGSQCPDCGSMQIKATMAKPSRIIRGLRPGPRNSDINLGLSLLLEAQK